MIIKNHFNYIPIQRVEKNGVRHYRCPATEELVPSVTTILTATKDNTGLLEWRKRVGDFEADQQRDQACGLGSLMHLHLENYVLGQDRPGGTNYARVQAEKMANVIIERGLVNVTEVWGQEVNLYYPGLYAGTTDLIGLYKDVPAIMDYKTTRKMKKRKDIEDYFHQISAYGMAHDEIYGTKIELGVIFMVDREYNYSEFVIDIEEMKQRKEEWINRLTRYFTENPSD